MMSIRDFLRGGYQQVREPTILLYHSTVLGTFVPGTIDDDYAWSPSPLRPPELPVAISALADQAAAPIPDGAAPAPPSTRVAYRALRARRARRVTPSDALPGWLTGERDRDA